MWCVIISTCLARAQTTAPLADNEKTPRQLFDTGERLLIQGRNFERAITVLREAVRREPKNSDYVLALGCAYASRAATLSRALVAARHFDIYTKRHANAVKIWQAGQGDEKSAVFGIERPKPERAPPRTRDDNRIFKTDAKTLERTEPRIKALCAAACARWDEGVALVETEPVETQAAAMSARAWGRLLLWMGPREAVPGSWPEKKVPTFVEILQVLEKIAALAPDDVRYLRAAGDAYGFLGFHKGFANPPARNKSVQILTKVLDKTPDDAFLRLYISLQGQSHAFINAEGSLAHTTVPVTMVDVIKEAVKTDPTNAQMHYTLFAAAGAAKQYDVALAALEAGNAAPRLTALRYPIQGHRWTRWAFPPVLMNPKQNLWQAFKNLHNFAKNETDDPTAAMIRYKRAVLRMARQYTTMFRDPNIADADERTFYEFSRWLSSGYGGGVPPALQGYFPQTDEDQQLLTTRISNCLQWQRKIGARTKPD